MKKIITEEEVYDKAVEYAKSMGRISEAILQKQFKIGYNIAGNIIKRMVNDGLIIKEEGSLLWTVKNN